MIYMFCYDIANPKRLKKVAKSLERVGIRIQKSFFQCEMEKKEMEQVKRIILKELKLMEDSFFIYRICEKCARQALKDGNGIFITLENFQIL